MPRASRFTPLAEIQAVVLDTETTGLDVTACRIVQISGVRFANGVVLGDKTLDLLVNPGVPIPPQATAVHGIDDAMVAGAPSFARAKAELDAFVGDAVLIGQSIGFDLAVLLRETHLAGGVWREPQFLDTKLLAAALDPAARELGLDALAARLGVSISDRHRALGDALVTAQIFARLLPQLAAAGIRTLGEAQARSNAQLRIRARQSDQGWYDATSVRPPDAFESGSDAQALVRFDSFAYRHRVEHVMSRSPVIVPPSTLLGNAIRRMAEEGLRAVLAGDPESGRADGILTQGDALKAIARTGAAALSLRLEAAMTAPVATMPSDAFVYRALARMQRLGVAQLPVEDSGRRIVGIVSLRDLLEGESGQAVVLGDRLSTAPTPRALATVRAELPAMVRRLLAEEVPPPEVSAILSAELRELLARAAVLAEKRMESEGSGRPPVAYALLAVDRIGRAEALLDSEPEHALVFASGEPAGPEAAWFGDYAAHLADVLTAAGCRWPAGAVVATDARWSRSLDGWLAEVGRWSAGPEPAPAARFLDFRLAYGDQDLSEDLRSLALEAAGPPSGLARALAPSHRVASTAPAEAAVDLAVAGLAPIEAAARALAVAGAIPALSTAERLAEACSRTGLSRHTADEFTELHEKLHAILLRQQARDHEAGRPTVTAVTVGELPAPQRAEVEEALARAARVGDVVRVALALV